MVAVCMTMVFLSGLTGLIYQVTWQKYLSVLLGSHAAASSVILALFFVFLSLGYSVLGKYAHKISRNNLGLYGGFEFLIGLYALYSPALFRVLFESYVNYANISGEQDYFYGMIFCGLFIFVPSFLMGGTIPVLVQALSSDYNVSSRVHSRIYALNTIGAFFGCILAGFYLIEAFGLEDTLLMTGWLNLLIGLVAFAVIYKTKKTFEGPPIANASVAAKSGDTIRVLGIGIISFLSGFYVFSIEKLIIRMAGLVYGSSAYTYSIVVGAFILAIGVGSYILSVNDRKLTERLFFGTLVLSIFSLIALYLYVPNWPDSALRIRVIFQSSLINFTPYWATVLIFSLLIFIVPAGLLGTNLPFLFSLLKKEKSELSNLVGRLYSINCVGAAVGAVLGGYWFFKLFSADTIFRLSIGTLIVSAIVAIAILDFDKKSRLRYSAILVIMAIVTLVLPRWDVLKFVPGRHLITTVPSKVTSISELNSGLAKSDILFSAYDPNTHVAVAKSGAKDLVLYVNGKPDAATSGDHLTRALAALNPISLLPFPVKRIFIAGLGAGLSTSVATKFSEVEMVDVAEISEGVKRALPYFDNFNFDLANQKNKYNVEVGDAYKVLMSKKDKYDLIICEPSNPWVSGVEKLFSTEFYGQVRNHLSENGMFAQWFPIFGMDEVTFLTILNTYSRAFPWVSVWSAGGSALTIFGSEKPLNPNFDLVTAKFNANKEMYKKFNINDPMTIFQSQLLTPAQVKLLVHKVEETQSVFTPTLEFKAGRGQFADLNVDISGLLYRRALLPVPNEFSEEIWPIWKLRGYKPNLTSYKDSTKLDAGTIPFQVLRLLLQAQAVPEIQKEFGDQIKTLADYNALLGQEKLQLKPGENIDDRISQLSLKVRQLQAFGYRPPLSVMTEFIEKECGTEAQCIKSKYIFLGWHVPPTVWDEVYSKIDAKAPTAAQAQRIVGEYEAVKSKYREMKAF